MLLARRPVLSPEAVQLAVLLGEKQGSTKTRTISSTLQNISSYVFNIIKLTTRHDFYRE